MNKGAESAAESETGLRFLVIEDMTELAELMAECLRARDFKAEVASTGEAALRLLRSGSFDVALVDIDLPDTNGFEVVARATAAGCLGRTRIVFCTGSRSAEHRQRAARFPGSRFLWKPFAFSELMKCVSEITADQVQHEPRGICQPCAPGGRTANEFMNEKRNWRFKYRLPKPLPGGAKPLEAEEVERELMGQLETSGGKSLGALWGLAQLCNHTRRSEQALEYLKQILALETDLEAKAHCILALGQATEQLGDFPAAARFYREAFAMEPVSNEVWYLINNNLGYCLNKAADHCEAEKFCRAAIVINPKCHNAYKNLGIALEGQGRGREAAACFVRATQQNANDPRATEHLGQLLKNRPELKEEFSHDLELCCRSVAYVAAVSERARQGIALQVLLGTNEPPLTQQVISTIEAIVDRRVQVLTATGWDTLVEQACSQPNDLIFVAPHQLNGGPAGVNALEKGLQMLRSIMSSSPAWVIVLIENEQLATWKQRFKDSGADAVIGLPFAPNALAEAIKPLVRLPR